MPKKELTLKDLEPQYAAFCENVKAVKQNTYWRTAFNKMEKPNGQKENKETL
jgi:hypothetical protein